MNAIESESGNESSGRNRFVEAAVNQALERVDAFIAGEKIDLPQPPHRRACEKLLDEKSASVKTAALFLMFYWLEDQTWDMNSVPVGSRGKYGDKKLCEELTNRNITLHGTITAYAENLGFKGDVRSKKLLEDDRFKEFLKQVADAKDKPEEIRRIADYMAQRFAESKREATPLPPVGTDVLTFVRANILFHKLLAIRSEGHIQQFLIAALLHEYRRRHSIEITTHHPHAADRFDETAGDIEEWRDGQLVRAYEVTVRDDWKNRISNFKEKMDRFGLSKYIIIAARINADSEWKVPAKMALKLEPYGRDIAVLDIEDVVHFLAAELTPQELREAVNQAFLYVSDRRLSGRPDFKELYTKAVHDWLDEVTPPHNAKDAEAESE
jgi:hypothetical protein